MNCLHDKMEYKRAQEQEYNMNNNMNNNVGMGSSPRGGGGGGVPRVNTLGDESIIRGLNMDHVLNDQYHDGGYNDGVHRGIGGNPRGGFGGGQDHMNMMLPQMGHHPHEQQQHSMMGSPRSSNNNHNANNNAGLPGNTVNQEGDYVIEGTFQQKGCACQTADDVGYLFGCGTNPQDEVVYVYNTKPGEPPQGPPAAMADERNLWYHTASSFGPPGGDNVNDVLFQIDKEYQAMQMGSSPTNHNHPMHNHEFLRDPLPAGGGVGGGVSSYPKSQAPRGHFTVDNDDDEYTRRSSCSFSSLLDFVLPGSRRHRHKLGKDHPHLSPRKGTGPNGGFWDNYQDSHLNFICASPRRNNKRNRNRAPPPTSSGSFEDNNFSSSSFDKTKKIVKTASNSVVELQHQLKAMVHDRALRSVASPTEETRQEPTPPASPKKEFVNEECRAPSSPLAKATTTTEDAAAKAVRDIESAAEKESEKLRNEQASLDQARKLLQVEMAAHQRNIAAQAQAQMNAQYMGAGMGMAGGMVMNPLSMNPLSPLTTATGMATPMMATTAPMTAVPVPQMNMLWGQQQQMNNGMVGMQQSAMNMMQNGNGQLQQQTQPQDSQQHHQQSQPQVAQQQQQQPQVINNDVMRDAKSVMSRSTFGGHNREGKFIDNVGAYPSRTKPTISPKTPSQARSPASRPNPSSRLQPPGHQAHPRPNTTNNQPNPVRGGTGTHNIRSASSFRSKNEEFAQSNQMLTDLKMKNELIQQDISRMKGCLGEKNNKGVNVAAGVKVGVRKSYSNVSHRRPFPRTSPPSSPSNKARYEFGEDPVTRAMQRSDEARSVRGSNGSVSSAQQYNRSSPRNRASGGYRRQQQPPNPMQTTKRQDQDYYHV